MVVKAPTILFIHCVPSLIPNVTHPSCGEANNCRVLQKDTIVLVPTIILYIKICSCYVYFHTLKKNVCLFLKNFNSFPQKSWHDKFTLFKTGQADCAVVGYFLVERPLTPVGVS